MSRAADLASVGAGIASSANATAISISATEVVTLLTSAVATSEGGAVTTNIAQGLCKYWCEWDQSGTISVYDSFNHASITDDASSLTTLSFTSDFASTNYVISGATTGVGYDTANVGTDARNEKLAGQVQMRTKSIIDNNPENPDDVMVHAHGDLA